MKNFSFDRYFLEIEALIWRTWSAKTYSKDQKSVHYAERLKRQQLLINSSSCMTLLHVSFAGCWERGEQSIADDSVMDDKSCSDPSKRSREENWLRRDNFEKKYLDLSVVVRLDNFQTYFVKVNDSVARSASCV